jgi:SAM-dependent methyltransferase
MVSLDQLLREFHRNGMSDLPDRIIGHYERHAREWDADRRRAGWSDKPWLDRFIATLSKGATVLDLGCGSGSPVAQHMVQSGLHVTGVDSSPTLVSLCRERLPDQEWIVADMRTLALDQKFAGILAWDSFFHLAHDDQRRMFRVFEAHAAASAVLTFNAGPSHGEGIGGYRGDPLYHASLSPDEYQTLLDKTGFDIVEHAVEDWRSGGGRTVWLAYSRA